MTQPGAMLKSNHCAFIATVFGLLILSSFTVSAANMAANAIEPKPHRLKQPAPKALQIEPVRTELSVPTPPEPVKSMPLAARQKTETPSPKSSASSTIFFAPAGLLLEPAQCLVALRKLNVTFIQNQAYGPLNKCAITNPVQLTSFMSNGKTIEFPDQPTLNCTFALQLIRFINESASPIIVVQTSSYITKFSTGPGFVCRGRNGDIQAKLSEHAFGNAVDITHIELAGGRIIPVMQVTSSNTKDHAILTAIRHSACMYFTTVLGPGADAAHTDHFHFDLGQHGKNGTYRICQ